ncbi:cyclophilin-like fold protein [Nonomuraea jabiensis]|uniref:Cyclophilin-like domain-containing protein n=1 Tax=Nonomuraea jabiensis TaxID=882448 RepID=A0A7W9LGV6_9ACTN|nr:cyclophilin-like fold protein [Nonomuraea jabiensis]MBB5783356.1 hypothetical protein [Nonomuraea jabiensis]
MLTKTLIAGSLLSLTGCAATGPAPAASGPVAPPSSPASAGAAGTPNATPARQVEGSVVRFTARGVSVDVVIGADNATTRDFLSMLPLTLTLEEFSGREKIGYLPRKLDTTGSPGSDPEDGDLIYLVPWGNLGFYYNTDGIGHSDQVIHLRNDDAIARQRLSAGSSTPRTARRYPGGVILGDDPRTADTQVSIIPAAGTQGLTAVADIRHADTQISGFPPVGRQTAPLGTGRQAVRFGRETMIAGILLGRAPRTLSSQHARAWATSLLQTRLLPWKKSKRTAGTPPVACSSSSTLSSPTVTGSCWAGSSAHPGRVRPRTRTC